PPRRLVLAGRHHCRHGPDTSQEHHGPRRAEQYLLLPPEPAPLGPREPARTAGPGRRNTHARLVTGSGNGLTGERRRALRLRNTGRHGAVLRQSTAGGTDSAREGRATPVGRLTLRRRRACVGGAVL